MNFGKLLLLLFHDMVGLNLFLFGSKLVAAVEGRTFLHLVPGREKKKIGAQEHPVQKKQTQCTAETGLKVEA